MKEVIIFREVDGDVIYELGIDDGLNFNFKIGDPVYSEIPKDVKERIKWFYPHGDIGGDIVSRWIDLTDRKIHWLVDVAFVRCD